MVVYKAPSTLKHAAESFLLCCKLDFAHFKRHYRRDLQVDSAERPGVPEYLGQLRTVKNLPTPATDGAAPERWPPLLS